MKKTLTIIIVLVSTLFFCGTTYADCRGCCSHHGGVVCSGGVTRCADGTSLSAKCRAKGCNKCGAYIPPVIVDPLKISVGTSTTSGQTPLTVTSSTAAAGGNTTNDSFSKSKKLLLKQVYYDHRTTFYCDCPFTADKRIIPSDKFSPTTKHVKRSRKVEWEHVVPAHAFGQSFSEWRNGDPGCVDKKGKPFKGRNCAEKMNMEYRYMQADMYNLVPANGQVNALRSNYSYAMIPGEPRIFGSCDMEIEDRKAEPRPEIRGDIARTYFYMDDAYPVETGARNSAKNIV